VSRPANDARPALDSALHDAMIAARRHLHAHPELSNEERKTQGFIRRWLVDHRVGAARIVAGTGLAIDIVGEPGASNRKIAIRADIDALPIAERSGVAFALS
jgi:metal-dependent amidase/aminoacylase/carboxypeptidase family protein